MSNLVDSLSDSFNDSKKIIARIFKVHRTDICNELKGLNTWPTLSCLHRHRKQMFCHQQRKKNHAKETTCAPFAAERLAEAMHWLGTWSRSIWTSVCERKENIGRINDSFVTYATKSFRVKKASRATCSDSICQKASQKSSAVFAVNFLILWTACENMKKIVLFISNQHQNNNYCKQFFLLLF